MVSFKAWVVEDTLKEVIKTQEGSIQQWQMKHLLYIRYPSEPITMQDTDTMMSHGDERATRTGSMVKPCYLERLSILIFYLH